MHLYLKEKIKLCEQVQVMQIDVSATSMTVRRFYAPDCTREEAVSVCLISPPFLPFPCRILIIGATACSIRISISNYIVCRYNVNICPYCPYCPCSTTEGSNKDRPMRKLPSVGSRIHNLLHSITIQLRLSLTLEDGTKFQLQFVNFA